MKINIYHIFAYIYFFFNSLALPHGLLYTTIFTPIFYFWLVAKRQQLIISKFLILLIPFVFFHLYNGVEIYTYFRSLILILTVYIFVYVVYLYLITEGGESLKILFARITYFNFYLVLVAILLFFTPFRNLLWGQWSISPSLGAMPRLSLLTYEPSYYSTLLVPIVIYYLLVLVKGSQKQIHFFSAISLVFSLILSFSFGVILVIILAFGLFFGVKLLNGRLKKQIFNILLGIVLLAFFSFFVLSIFYPNNPFFTRIYDFISGNDSSGNGRTYEAFYLSYKIAELKSIWWGIGFGQVKLIGDTVIRNFYNYPVSIQNLSIPNTLGETLAVLGLIGLGIRFFLEVYLFFKTKVMQNDYQKLLFFYVFIYQFTGSFYTNIAEYVIWVFAFVSIFPEFNSKSKQPNL